MLFIQTTVTPEGKERVEFVHYFPDMLTDEEKANGKLVNATVLEPPFIEGKLPVLYYDNDSNSFFVEYINKPLTQEEKLSQLESEKVNMQNQITTMQETINFLLGI